MSWALIAARLVVVSLVTKSLTYSAMRPTS
jgi:hypothetical protein